MTFRNLALVAVSAFALAACGQPASETASTGTAPPPAVETTTTAAAPQMAPDFKLMDASGTERSLADFRGKVVVLEWNNEGCPYVQKHYNAGNMQALQKQVTDAGAVWLTIVSSSPGTQGYVEGQAARDWASRHSASPTHLLLDPTGVVGKQYGAVTTPDMRVIDEQGRIIFTGGIDDKPSSDASSLDGANNFVKAALSDHMAGRTVATPFAQPYGCSIKYPGEA